ncbi:MAG TPA: XdhC/CoxF family protein, partial [Firmicutes bacterium]|nr:XdhC/CoxF family protein [Bacillota bacterium]
EVTLFIEPFTSSDTLLIVGAGHIAQHLAAMAKMAGFAVTVLDDREEFCNRELFPAADQLLVGEIEELLGRVTISPQTYITIVTRGHRYDQLALEKTISSPACYLGMIGSARKVEATFNNLREMGVKPEDLKAVHSPIGLKIGAQTPAEIAVSILAEIIAVRKRVFKSRHPAALSSRD